MTQLLTDLTNAVAQLLTTGEWLIVLAILLIGLKIWLFKLWLRSQPDEE